MSEKRSGCRGCLIWIAGVSVLLALVVGVAGYLGYRKARAFVDRFAQKQPLTLPAVHYSKAELDAVQKRIDGFLAAAQSNRTNAHLTLSANDLNALVASSAFSNRVYLTLSSNAVGGRFSIPFEQLGMPLFRGRYLNGSGTLDIGAASGSFTISFREFAVNGVDLPEHYMNWIRQQDFARGFAADTNIQATLSRVARVAVENQLLILEVATNASDRVSR